MSSIFRRLSSAASCSWPPKVTVMRSSVIRKNQVDAGRDSRDLSTSLHAFVRELAREQDETSDEEKAREKERVQRVTERNDKPDTTTDEERTILIGRMHGWERMLVGGERDRV
ncbi:hypothetical protein ALC53_05504 [Atta colombica]|uniref:Uncharacterized protein n=1 Tax=Atta colombica TaxID=520822 RepID=A0A195BID1_9HYME|nr:hypothetical protein ALC53_05504 [Atta colombica]